MTAPATDLVTIDDLAAELNWSDTQKAKQAVEAARYISAVTTVIENITGPVVGQPFVEWHDGGVFAVKLLRSPVQAVDAVVESYGAGVVRTLTEQEPDSGGPLDAYGYSVELDSGLVTRRASGIACAFAPGVRNIHVTYSAGYCADTASVPPNIALAALWVIKDNWGPQQGGPRPYGTNTDEGTYDPSTGYFVAPKVLELLGAGSQIGVA